MSPFKIKTLYSILGVGVALAFLGHGVLGVKSEDKFIELVTGSYDKLLGGSMSTDAATTIVNAIGVVDIILSIAFITLVAAAASERALAYSPVALGLFSWAMVWGAATALSRFTAELNGAAIWEVVERGPNVMLPAGLVYLIYTHRRELAAHPGSAPVRGGPGKPALTLSG